MATLTRSQLRRAGTALTAATALVLAVPAAASAQTAPDPRAGLAPAGNTAASEVLLDNAGRAAKAMQLLGVAPTSTWSPAQLPMGGSNLNSDLAFTGNHAVMGNYQGFGIYDISNAEAPKLQTSVSCPGSQNDVSVYGNLLFTSVEQTTARIDCGAPVANQPANEVFRGVRIFDISNKANPVQLPGVQTCRGSHTHTIVTKPGVTDKIWIYVSGTSSIRTAESLPGCSSGSSLTDPTTANFRIDVIEVPLAAPQTAKVVSNPRLFSFCGSSACESDFATVRTHPEPGYGERGTLNWLSPGRVQPTYPPGSGREPGGQTVSQSSACHDITAYPEIGLAAGACQGDGLLIDISDPVNPQRIDNVTDYNFAYWHSATFNDAGTKVVFTDEWGGGSGARCRPTDPENWGADAIFDIVDTPQGKKLQFASYYSIPNVQSANENCVAHNGSLVPVPGRDVMVQAWYQGGTSVFDFTDSKNPKEIAYFDRGPIVQPTSPTAVALGGFWSTYWYNGSVVGSEIRLGLNTFGLTPSADLSANAIAAAKTVRTSQLNVQSQQRLVYPASFPFVRTTLENAVRTGSVTASAAADVEVFVARAEGSADRDEKTAAATLRARAGQLTGPGQQALATALDDLADSLAPYDASRIVGALVTASNIDGTISDRTTANLRERLDRAIAAADAGSEKSAIALLRQFIDRVNNQVKGNAADTAARRALVAAAETALLHLQAADEAEASR